jgi:hypothetical protein
MIIKKSMGNYMVISEKSRGNFTAIIEKSMGKPLILSFFQPGKGVFL